MGLILIIAATIGIVIWIVREDPFDKAISDGSVINIGLWIVGCCLAILLIAWAVGGIAENLARDREDNVIVSEAMNVQVVQNKTVFNLTRYDSWLYREMRKHNKHVEKKNKWAKNFWVGAVIRKTPMRPMEMRVDGKVINNLPISGY